MTWTCPLLDEIGFDKASQIAPSKTHENYLCPLLGRPMKQISFVVTTSFLSLSFLIICSEMILRASGHEPWTYFSLDRNEPLMHQPDPDLGWRNKEGEYTIPPYDPSSQPIHVTFLDQGRRATGRKESPAERGLIIVGCSFTQGWAISDAETYPWKLQEKLPAIRVLNYGTGGYGTYQSLLVLERQLPRMKTPVLVLYGFIELHEERNVATPEWLRGLSRFQRRAHVAIPYATIDESGALIRHPPERYLTLPFHEVSALIAYLEEKINWIAGFRRVMRKRSVTEQLMGEMKELSEKFGARFVVVLLYASDPSLGYYKERLTKAGIEFIDCKYPLTDEMRVQGEGHPNGKMHSLWAQCIQDGLHDKLS
jgi:hypothetical protein